MVPKFSKRLYPVCQAVAAIRYSLYSNFTSSELGPTHAHQIPAPDDSNGRLKSTVSLSDGPYVHDDEGGDCPFEKGTDGTPTPKVCVQIQFSHTKQAVAA
jgi:hypothetical protein